MFETSTPPLSDFLGVLTYIIPVLGESFDIVWAPISAGLLSQMYGMTPLVAVGFLEEILPGTDFIPTATIGWIAQYTTILPDYISYVRLHLQPSRRETG